MRDTLWLTANRRGVVKMTKGRPSLSAGERCVRVSITMPAEVFDVPDVQATIEVGPEHVVHPSADVEVLDPPLFTWHCAFCDGFGTSDWASTADAVATGVDVHTDEVCDHPTVEAVPTTERPTVDTETEVGP